MVYNLKRCYIYVKQKGEKMEKPKLLEYRASFEKDLFTIVIQGANYTLSEYNEYTDYTENALFIIDDRGHYLYVLDVVGSPLYDSDGYEFE